MTTGVWDLARHDTVAVLTYRREPENVLGFAGLAELDALLVDLDLDQSVSVVVLTGGVPGYFVAHADLDDVAALTEGRPTGPHGPEVWGQTMRRLSTIAPPVVAAVNGQAWGGGFELALACLMRVASSAASFGYVEVAHGAIPGAGGTQRLPRLVGLSTAARLVLGGEALDAAEAERLRLVEAVLPEEDFLKHVLEWLTPLSRAPRHSLVAAKSALVEGAELPLAEGLELEQRLFRQVLSSPETLAMHRSEELV